MTYEKASSLPGGDRTCLILCLVMMGHCAK